jgi:iron complex outermembrane receptor protein
LNNFTLDTDVAALFTQDGAPGERVQAVLNLPVLDDVLGFRVAATSDHEGGWVDQPAIERSNINDSNLTDVRVIGLWKPVAELTVSATGEIHRDDRGSNIGEDANGNYTQYFNQPTTPRIKDDFDILISRWPTISVQFGF